MVTLDLLIPQYKETFEIVKPLLDSLAVQQRVDFNCIKVIIVNDGSNVHLDEKDFDRYPFKVEYHINKHSGVSATRNKCLEYSKSDYVMFCDADDMFMNNCGLWLVMQELDKGCDGIVSNFVEEHYDRSSGKYAYLNRELDQTFVHGKIFKRQFLDREHIRFNPDLTVHEDSYFNILCQTIAPDTIKYCPSPFYLWRWREDSVCRRDSKYILKTYQDMIKSNKALVEELKNRNMINDMMKFVCMMIVDTYYIMNKDEWKNLENKEYRDTTELKFAEYFQTYRKIWNEASDDLKMAISNGIRQRYVNEGMKMEAVTFNDWIKHIEGLTQ